MHLITVRQKAVGCTETYCCHTAAFLVWFMVSSQNHGTIQDARDLRQKRPAQSRANFKARSSYLGLCQHLSMF